MTLKIKQKGNSLGGLLLQVKWDEALSSHQNLQQVCGDSWTNILMVLRFWPTNIEPLTITFYHVGMKLGPTTEAP